MTDYMPVITPLWGDWFFARGRAHTGQWKERGRVLRFTVRRARLRSGEGWGVHLVVGAWCLTLGRGA